MIGTEQSCGVGDQSPPVLFGRDDRSRRRSGLRAALAVKGEAEHERANDASANLSIFLNGGGGAFAAPVNHPVPGRPLYVAAGDFDGDLDFDLAAANGSTRLATVFLNRGDATFAM